MALLKQFSTSFWSLVSPQKQHNTTILPTPNSEPIFKKPRLPSPQRTSIREVNREARSMSPSERVGSWKVKSSELSSQGSASGHRKRKRSRTPETPKPRKRKMQRVNSKFTGIIDEEMDDYIGSPVDEEDELDELFQDNIRLSTPQSSSRYRSSTPASHDFSDADDGHSVDTSLVVSENEYVPMPRKKLDLPTEHSMRHISDEELRAQGWDDDYITLIQKIGMRGHEPLLPNYLKFEYKFLPDLLFEDSEDAFVASVRGEHFKASKALEKLLEVGSRVRDKAELYEDGLSYTEPEQETKKHLNAFMKWAFNDARIDKKTAIPILATVFRPAGTDAAELRAEATRKCRRLASRYREAFQVKRSIEFSPGSETTKLSDELPTLYAFVASHTIVAIMAYKPNEPDAEASHMAYFDLNELSHDVWNALAFAILVCHVRNVQARIAEETGLGLKQQFYGQDEMEADPDL